MKKRQILTITVTTVSILMVVFSGVMKFSGDEALTKQMETVGVLSYILVLGSMEIIFALLFLFKPTMKIGFILLTCYFSGALATELSHGTALNAILPLALVWSSAFLRDKSIFLPFQHTGLTKTL